MITGVHRLLASYRGQPAIEIWRGKNRQENLSPNSIMAMTCDMSTNWDVWMFRPLPDSEAIGRVALLNNEGPKIMVEDESALPQEAVA